MGIAGQGASRRSSALLNKLRRKLNSRRTRLLLFVTLIVVILAHLYAPPQHVPWKPLDMEADIGLATGSKITLVSLAPSAVCLRKLEAAKHLEFSRAEPKREQKKCGWKIATTMTEASDVSFKPRDVTSQCSVMLASYIWLRDVDKAAEKYLGSGLQSIHHAGTYSCRRQRGNNSGAWSEHAFANAWDVTGFQLDDGRVVSVLRDWEKGKTDDSKKRATFLRKARKSACRVFRVVLSPDYNAAHKDHFHLDQGPSLSCR